MNIAFLFNSDDPKYGVSYGDPIRKAVFGLGIIQATNRHMKVSIGDVLIYGSVRNWEEYDKLTARTYFAGTWAEYLPGRLQATFRRATVYALTFENMTRQAALALHQALAPDGSYLGFLARDIHEGRISRVASVA